MHLVLFVAPALQSTAIVLLALLGIAMLGLAACSCSKKNSAVASKILSKSHHLIEKNTAEQLLGQTQYRARVGRFRISAKLITRERWKTFRVWELTVKDMECLEVLYLNYTNNRKWWISFTLTSFAGSVNPFKVHFALTWSVWKRIKQHKQKVKEYFKPVLGKNCDNNTKVIFMFYNSVMVTMDLLHKNQKLFIGHALRRVW